MRTTVANQSNGPIDIAKGNELLAQHADRVRDVLKIPRKAHRVPIIPQHLSSQAVGGRLRVLGQEFLIGVGGLKRWHALCLSFRSQFVARSGHYRSSLVA